MRVVLPEPRKPVMMVMGMGAIFGRADGACEGALPGKDKESGNLKRTYAKRNGRLKRSALEWVRGQSKVQDTVKKTGLAR